ncbi:MAG: hypothetical protein ABI857_02880 [Acidobacteriota bacterium]
MDLRKLKEFLLDETGTPEIIGGIESEIEVYKNALAKKGASAPVIGTNDDFQYVIKREDVQKLCDLYLAGQLDEWHLNYIANLIELSSSFSMESKRVEEAVFDLSSPEINGDINAERIRIILESLE